MASSAVAVLLAAPSPDTWVVPAHGLSETGLGRRGLGETMDWGRPVFVQSMIRAIPGPGAAGLLDCREPGVCGRPGLGQYMAWQEPEASASRYCLAPKIIGPLIAVLLSGAVVIEDPRQEEGTCFARPEEKARGFLALV